MKLKDYLLNETVVTIKASKSTKEEVKRILDKLNVDYSDAGTYELEATFKSRKEAKKVLDKLPSVRYTIDDF